MPHTVNLPTPPTPFIGRASEIAELVTLMNNPDCRLLSLVGMGGIGKTRLALEIAERAAEHFPNGLVFVPLAHLNDAAEVVSTIINVLGIRIDDASTPEAALITVLLRRAVLLILDNIEHLLDSTPLIVDILADAPDVKILVTSREVLNVQEEWVWQVRGLRFPEETVSLQADDYGALQLFAERASRVQQAFSLEAELDCAIKICRLVDGMPLAIELAASWLKTLACDEIVAEIERSIDILTTNLRNIPERHRSMRTVFDASWAMCSPQEQSVFQKLCVFRGGFERDAAQKVAGATLPILTVLVEKSMVWKLPTGRYRIHELLRQYQAEKSQDEDPHAVAQDAHMAYFADFVRDGTTKIKGRHQLEGLNALDADLYNVRVAWFHATDRHDLPVLDMMVEGLVLFCDMRARYQTGETMLRHTLQILPPPQDETARLIVNRLRVRWLQVWLLQERTPFPAEIRQTLEHALQTARESDDKQTIALCLWSKGELHRFSHDQYDDLEAYQQAHDLFENIGATYYRVRVLRGMVHYYFFNGDVDTRDSMIRLNRQHLDLARDLQDRIGMAHAIYYNGVISLFITGTDKDESHRLLLDALNIWQEMGDRKSEGVVLAILGMMSWLDGYSEQAITQLTQARIILEDANFRGGIRTALANLGFVAALSGDQHQARELFTESTGYHPSPSYTINLNLRGLSTAIFLINEEDYDGARRMLHNVTTTIRFPLGKLLILPIAAMLLAHANAHQSAVQLLSLAYNHPLNIIGWMNAWERLSRLRRELAHLLGDDAYDRAWEQGEALNLDDTINDLHEQLASSTLSGSTYSPLADPLSEREQEVLVLLAQGLSNKEIADELVVAVSTVKVHTRNIYNKLAVTNRTEAAATARKLNLI